MFNTALVFVQEQINKLTLEHDNLKNELKETVKEKEQLLLQNQQLANRVKVLEQNLNQQPQVKKVPNNIISPIQPMNNNTTTQISNVSYGQPSHSFNINNNPLPPGYKSKSIPILRGIDKVLPGLPQLNTINNFQNDTRTTSNATDVTIYSSDRSQNSNNSNQHYSNNNNNNNINNNNNNNNNMNQFSNMPNFMISNSINNDNCNNYENGQYIQNDAIKQQFCTLGTNNISTCSNINENVNNNNNNLNTNTSNLNTNTNNLNTIYNVTNGNSLKRGINACNESLGTIGDSNMTSNYNNNNNPYANQDDRPGKNRKINGFQYHSLANSNATVLNTINNKTKNMAQQ